MGDIENRNEEKKKSRGKRAYELTFEDIKNDSIAGRGIPFNELQDPDAIARYIEQMEKLEIRELMDKRNRETGLSARLRSCEESGGGACYDELSREEAKAKALFAEQYKQDKEDYLAQLVMEDDFPEDPDLDDDEKKSEPEKLTLDERLLTLEAQSEEARSDYAKFLRDAHDAHEKSVLMAIPVLKKSESLYVNCQELSNGIENFCVSEGLHFQCFNDMRKTYVETTQLDDAIQKKYPDDLQKYNEVTGKLHSMRDALFQKLTEYEETNQLAESLLDAELKAYERMYGPEAAALQKRYEERLKKLRVYKKTKQ